jgi:hypothetical protein
MMRSIALLALLVVWTFAWNLAAADDPRALSAKATKLYKAKHYTEACPIFERVTALEPANGRAWTDLGLCLGRWGHEEDAVAANHKAIAASAGDERARKAAYFNLAKLSNVSIRSHLPGPTEDVLRDLEGPTPRCEVFDAPVGCASAVWGCFQGYYVRLGLDPHRLVREKPVEVDLSGEDVEPVAGGDAVPVSAPPGWGGGPSTCDHHKLECRIVWADACSARAGVVCDDSWEPGPSRVDDDEQADCPAPKVLVRELTLR